MSRSPDRACPCARQVNPECSQLRFGISAEADSDRHVADHIFQDQVPADDPGKNFAQRCIGIGVGAARDRNHRRQLGIAQAGKTAGHGHQQKRDCDRRTGWRTPVHQRSRRRTGAQEGADQVQNLRVQNGRRFEVLTRRSRAGKHEDPRADDGADAERSERPWPQCLFKTMSGFVGFRDQLVDGLAAEQLVVRRAGRWWLCQRVLVSCAFGISNQPLAPGIQTMNVLRSPLIAECRCQLLLLPLRGTARHLLDFALG